MTTPNSCKSPDVGRLLPKYFADLLDDSTSEEVENHLAGCSHCKKQYRTLLGVLRAGRVKHAKMTNVNSQIGTVVRKPIQPAQPGQPAAAALATAGTAVQPKGKSSDGP